MQRFKPFDIILVLSLDIVLGGNLGTITAGQLLSIPDGPLKATVRCRCLPQYPFGFIHFSTSVNFNADLRPLLLTWVHLVRH